MKVNPHCINVLNAEIKSVVIPMLIQGYWDNYAYSDPVFSVFFESDEDIKRRNIKYLHLNNSDSSYVYRKDAERFLNESVERSRNNNPIPLSDEHLTKLGLPIVDYKLKQKCFPLKRTQVYNIIAGLLGEKSYSAVKNTLDPFAKPLLLCELFGSQSDETSISLLHYIVSRLGVSEHHQKAAIELFKSLLSHCAQEDAYDKELMDSGYYGLASLLCWGDGYIELREFYGEYLIGYIDAGESSVTMTDSFSDLDGLNSHITQNLETYLKYLTVEYSESCSEAKRLLEKVGSIA